LLHKISNKLSENQTVKVEDFKIKNISKKAKGDKQVQKVGLIVQYCNNLGGNSLSYLNTNLQEMVESL